MFVFVVAIDAIQTNVLMSAHASRNRPRPSPTEPPAFAMVGAQKARSRVTPSQNPANTVKTTPTNVSPRRNPSRPAINWVTNPLAIITAKVTGPVRASTRPALTVPTTPTETPKLASPSARGSPRICAPGPTVGPAIGMWTGAISPAPTGHCASSTTGAADVFRSLISGILFSGEHQVVEDLHGVCCVA